jgi:DNA gyrase/topoisomerase IV subunit B
MRQWVAIVIPSELIYEDGSISVEDNGRGIPVGIHKKRRCFGIEVVTKIGAGGKFDKDLRFLEDFTVLGFL